MSENPYISPEHVGDSLPPKNKRTWLTVLIVLAIGGVLVALLMPVSRSAPEAARRNSCINNMKRIGLALQNYADAYGALPPAYTVDGNGKPLHSWRTLILPFMEEQELYKSIDLSKPWDDPANAKAYNAEYTPYACPASTSPPNHTSYLAIVTPEACFDRIEPRPLAEITDRRSQTLMVIEAPTDKAVHWMCPQDADEEVLGAFGPDAKMAHSGSVACVLFADGHVSTITSDLPQSQLRAMISIAGNEEIPDIQ